MDHGKTTLVRYMTGTDTDRLEEEHRRGISIVAGYAELDLPSGRRASLVDVPGHERFVKNMVAGATGIDAFLLVVAADDGVMPQTREHLDVLRVLGVERGVVALTKTDAVDEETVELAELDVEELLESVGVSAPVLRVSGVSGDGVAELLQALDGLTSGTGDSRSGEGLARLPVDRSFVLKGIGVVVTGTLWSGEIRPGDTLYTPSGQRPRIRGIQNHGHSAEVAYPGARTALDLSGIEADRIEPGEVLLSRPIPATRDLDVRLRVLESSRPLAHGVRVRFHHGTRSTNARVRLTDGDELGAGRSALARLKLEEPLVVLAGDRFVLRSMAPQVTIGGGTVLDASPTGRKPDANWLEALESKDARRIVPLALARSPREGATTDELALISNLSPETLPSELEKAPEIVKVGDLYALPSAVHEAREHLLASLRERTEQHPESPEITVAEARNATGLDTRLAEVVLEEMDGAIEATASGVRLLNTGAVPQELERGAEALRGSLLQAGTEPPVMEPSPALRLLLKRAEAVELGGGLYAARETSEDVLEQIKAICRAEGEISLAGLRDRLGTSRKFAQAWLEYSDSQGVTSRTGDVRVLTRRYR